MSVLTQYLPSMASHAAYMAEMHPKVAGSTWIVTLNGKEWPVMLCDESLPPKPFQQIRRSPLEIPAIQLGRRRYLWVRPDDLQELDPHRDYLDGLPRFENEDVLVNDNEATKLEKQRHIAFKQDAAAWESPEYWKNFIDSRRAAQELEREMSRSRSGSSGVKRKRSGDSDEIEVISSRRKSRSKTSSGSPTKRERRPKNGKAANGHLPTPRQTPHKNGAKSAVPQDVLYLDDDGSDDESMFIRETRPDKDSGPSSNGHAELQEKLRDDYEQRLKTSPRKDGEDCTIIVGDEATPFLVPYKTVGDFDLLADLVEFNEERGSHVFIPDDLDVSAKDFIPVAEYLLSGDFTPKLTEKPGMPPKLDGVFLPQHKDKAAECIAMVFNTASKLEMGRLQTEAMNKLRATYPLTPMGLLVVTMIISRSKPWNKDIEDEAEGWIVDHIVEHFWRFVELHGPALKRLMSESADLRTAVFEKLASNPGVGMGDLDE